MDINLYKREVDRLSNEVNDIKEDLSIEPKLGKSIGILQYKNYLFIAIGSLAILYLIKPKIVLKIVFVDEAPKMVLNVGKFILTWIVMTIMVSLIYFTYLKFKKS